MPAIQEDSYRKCDNCDFRGREVVRGAICKECNGDGELEHESDYL